MSLLGCHMTSKIPVGLFLLVFWFEKVSHLGGVGKKVLSILPIGIMIFLDNKVVLT